jgi:hypothetical protein
MKWTTGPIVPALLLHAGVCRALKDALTYRHVAHSLAPWQTRPHANASSDANTLLARVRRPHHDLR